MDMKIGGGLILAGLVGIVGYFIGKSKCGSHHGGHMHHGMHHHGGMHHGMGGGHPYGKHIGLHEMGGY